MFFIYSNGNLISSIDGKSMTSHLGMTSTDITDMNPASYPRAVGQTWLQSTLRIIWLTFREYNLRGSRLFLGHLVYLALR